MLSQKVQDLKESATLAMAAKATKLKEDGVDIITMSLGEPDFDTPDLVKKAAVKAIEQNFSHYSPVPGFKELRKAISDKFKKENSLDYTPEQIVCSTGAKQCIANLAISLLDEGDEAILPAPFWVSYRDIIEFAGGKSVSISTDINSDFKITPSQLENAITKKTKFILYSNPCNPSGSVYSKEEILALADFLKKHPTVFIVSDEIYEYIYFGENPYFSIGSVPELKERVITVNGLSKGFAMTGWRLGYLGAPLAVARACSKVQGQFTSGTNTVAQVAAIAALKAGRPSVEYMREAFLKRRDLLIDHLSRIPGLKTNKPMGAFYLFPDVSYYFGKEFEGMKIQNSQDFSHFLLEQAKVATTPGDAFGCPKNIRLSYATSEEVIIEAVRRIKEVLLKLL